MDENAKMQMKNLESESELERLQEAIQDVENSGMQVQLDAEEKQILLDEIEKLQTELQAKMRNEQNIKGFIGSATGEGENANTDAFLDGFFNA